MSDPSQSAVLDALRPIIDPDFGKSIVDLGFVKDLRVEGSRVAFSIELTTPACPVKEEFERSARERVLALPGVEQVDVTMTANTRGRSPTSEADVLEQTEQATRLQRGGGGPEVRVTSKGGEIVLRPMGGKTLFGVPLGRE